MSIIPNIQNRLTLLGITDDTKHNIGSFYPHLIEGLDHIIGKFYTHMLSFPEGREIFADHDIRNTLKPRQYAHWTQLFSCRFDEQYVSSAMKVGQIHYDRKIAPYLYMAGYTFIHCEIITLASQKYGNSSDLPNILSSITRLVTLDMDLSMSAYTREHWRGAPAAA